MGVDSNENSVDRRPRRRLGGCGDWGGLDGAAGDGGCLGGWPVGPLPAERGDEGDCAGADQGRGSDSWDDRAEEGTVDVGESDVCVQEPVARASVRMASGDITSVASAGVNRRTMEGLVFVPRESAAQRGKMRRTAEAAGASIVTCRPRPA